MAPDRVLQPASLETLAVDREHLFQPVEGNDQVTPDLGHRRVRLPALREDLVDPQWNRLSQVGQCTAAAFVVGEAQFEPFQRLVVGENAEQADQRAVGDSGTALEKEFEQILRLLVTGLLGKFQFEQQRSPRRPRQIDS